MSDVVRRRIEPCTRGTSCQGARRVIRLVSLAFDRRARFVAIGISTPGCFGKLCIFGVIVGSFLGANAHFAGSENWLPRRRKISICAPRVNQM